MLYLLFLLDTLNGPLHQRDGFDIAMVFDVEEGPHLSL